MCFKNNFLQGGWHVQVSFPVWGLLQSLGSGHHAQGTDSSVGLWASGACGCDPEKAEIVGSIQGSLEAGVGSGDSGQQGCLQMCVTYVYLAWSGCSVLIFHMLYSRMTLSEAVLTALLSWILHCGASEDRLGAGSSFKSCKVCVLL